MDLRVLDDVPKFSGRESEREQLDCVADWLVRLAEMLRYNLSLLEERQSGEAERRAEK